MGHISTPWGISQTEKEIADGILDVTTAGHGGMRISADRWTELIKTIPNVESWTGKGWLEEDCDWALAVMTWPDLFSPRLCWYAAKETTRRTDLAGYIDSPKYIELQQRASQYQPDTKEIA